jgi:hypothetical protein
MHELLVRVVITHNHALHLDPFGHHLHSASARYGLHTVCHLTMTYVRDLLANVNVAPHGEHAVLVTSNDSAANLHMRQSA